MVKISPNWFKCVEHFQYWVKMVKPGQESSKMVQLCIILSKMVKYGQDFDYKVIPMGPAYNQVSWSSFHISMFSDQKEIKYVAKDKDNDKTVVYFWFSLLQKVKGSGYLNKLDVQYMF